MKSLALAVGTILLASLVLPAASAQQTVRLTITSAYADGAAPPSMWSTIRLQSDGSLVASGFTPLNANVLPGVSYAIYTADYQDITFHHWEDTGMFERPRGVTIGADSTFTAVYISDAHPLPSPDPEPDPEPSGESILTVNSQYADGTALSGYYAVLQQGGTTLATGFTPVDFTLTSGSDYAVSVGDYNGVTFHHWENDSTTRLRPLNISNDIIITAHYISDDHPLPEPEPEFTPVTHMSDTTQSYGVLVSGSANSGNHQIAAELVNSGSVLVGKPIDEITLMLRRVGTPVGDAEVAVFDANRNIKKLFAAVPASNISTAMNEMLFTIPDLYTIEEGDRIGLRFTGGSTSSGISVMMDKVTTDNIFDGQNTQRARGTSTGWLTSDINEDLYMVLRQTKDSGVTDQPPSAQPVSATVQENNSDGVRITLEGSDPEGQPLKFYAVTQPAKGVLSLVDGNVVTYTPYDWHDGQDSFQYVSHDGVQASDPATVSVSIQNTGAKTTSRIVVITVFEDGKSHAGAFTSLSQGGTVINSGYSHIHFDVNDGQNYTVTMGSGTNIFVRWQDTGSTNPSRQINISQDTAVIAVYRRG